MFYLGWAGALTRENMPELLNLLARCAFCDKSQDIFNRRSRSQVKGVKKDSGWHVCIRQHQTEAETNDIHRTRREMRLGRLTIENIIRNKQQKAGARHGVKENMGRDKRHPQHTPRNETMTFDNIDHHTK